ncbi:MAG: bifunctional glutamate N-acetyltransferase/amino-acid acetyltransferase ArgJ [Lachnospiraceae bacterium]|nr:bifunctional glutamate N-acetyltransferase/amino-acid acetyltransferase ArgJ [Lachnospiraceae bacterium]
MEWIDGGVTAATGFYASGVYAGIKKSRKDMAMVFSVVPATVAGAFTTNMVKAAPVRWDISLIEEMKMAQAVVLNSGVANACTGTKGKQNNACMAKAAAEALDISEKLVLTASTGVIGKQLPMDAIASGVKVLAGCLSDTMEAGTLAAESIMTTDTVKKEAAVTILLGGKKVTVGGMSKGSGMIHPNMATMLAVITTDAAISQELLNEAVHEVVSKTFNRISVDRDTSTNDSYMVLANGLAGNEQITKKDASYDEFLKALYAVSESLAKKMAADGEGATKLLEVNVIHAVSEKEAEILAKSVITSNLVKTAVFGNDANWGRILCALGYSGVQFDPEKVDLVITSSYGTLSLVSNGMATDYSEEEATKILSADAVTVTADMKSGEESATAWGCDLTYDYVKINADYRS